VLDAALKRRVIREGLQALPRRQLPGLGDERGRRL
jgi:hypothetical protein